MYKHEKTHYDRLPGDDPIIELSSTYVGVSSLMVCNSPHMQAAQKAISTA
jgi:hypothetical protein